MLHGRMKLLVDPMPKTVGALILSLIGYGQWSIKRVQQLQKTYKVMFFGF